MNNPKHEMQKLLFENGFADHSIQYILKDDNSIYSLSVSKSDPDEIISFIKDNDGNSIYEYVPDWDFSLDSYLLEDLEKGREIVYMPLEVLLMVWNEIGRNIDEIDHTDGLQKYLSYCQEQGINRKTLSITGEEVTDISNLYKEMNGSYEIIQSLTVQNETIVLGRSNTNPSPFVTWKTNPDRSDGYRSGHYFTKLEDAQRDFEERSKSLFKSKIREFQKSSKKKEESR